MLLGTKIETNQYRHSSLLSPNYSSQGFSFLMKKRQLIFKKQSLASYLFIFVMVNSFILQCWKNWKS